MINWESGARMRRNRPSGLLTWLKPCLYVLLLLTAYCLLLSSPASAQKVEEKARERIWKKDPFAPPPVTEAPVVAKDEIPALEVSAILYSEGRSSAVIDGRTVRIGDELYGQKVIDIKKGYVILGSGKKRYRLELRK